MTRPSRARALPLLLVALVLVLGACGTNGDAGAASAAPDRLPDTTLSSLTTEETLDLRSLRGPVVVNLWASWCTPCRRELPLYQEFSEKYDGRVDVLGIDFQETRPDAARELARETGVDYPLFSDPDGELRAVGLPKVILVDAQGRVAHEEYVEITSLQQLESLVEEHLGVPAAEATS